MSFQYKALRGQLAKTHTQGRVVLRDTGGGRGAHTRSCHGYDREMLGLQMKSTTWRSFSAAASFTPYFFTFIFYLLSFPPLQLLCSLAVFSLPLLNCVSLPLLPSFLHYTVHDKPLGSLLTQKHSPRLFSVQRGRGACVHRWDAAPSCGVPTCGVYYMCMYSSTLELVNFRALCVHVRVVERVARRVAFGRRQVLWRVSA